MNIVSLKHDNDSSSNDDLHLAANEPDSDDDGSILHDKVICCTAKNVSLSISAILELSHTSDMLYPIPRRLHYYIQLRLGFILVKKNMPVNMTYSVNAVENMTYSVNAVEKNI